MAKKKSAKKKKPTRKTLPKDLDALVDAAAESGDYAAVYEALERCLPDARGGYCKGTLLASGHCTLELARWAIERGTDVNAGDTYGDTPLHESARSRFHHRLTPAQLIELGADVQQANEKGQTPLHSAAGGKHLQAVETLLANGAQVGVQDRSEHTPLEHGLVRMSNADLADMLPVVKALLAAGAEVSEAARDAVRRRVEDFEFHRAGFNPDYVEETSAAAQALCALFAVEQPAGRVMHDGTSPIVVSGTPAERFEALWELLVPSSGPCATVQGEVVRIAGRVRDEWFRNGGVNWDSDFAAMAQALCTHLASHAALDAPELEACGQVVGSLRSDPDGSDCLAGWAVEWVARNPNPIALPAHSYTR